MRIGPNCYGLSGGPRVGPVTSTDLSGSPSVLVIGYRIQQPQQAKVLIQLIHSTKLSRMKISMNVFRLGADTQLASVLTGIQLTKRFRLI